MLRGEKKGSVMSDRKEVKGGQLEGSGEEMRGIERTWSPSQQHFIYFFFCLSAGLRLDYRLLGRF